MILILPGSLQLTFFFGGGVRVRFPVLCSDIPLALLSLRYPELLRTVHTGSGAQPSSYPICIGKGGGGNSFSGGKAVSE
jgi:hypothetical protein